MTDTDRPQDVGRKHVRRGRPSAETAALLDRYQSSMRSELGALLDELAPRPLEPGLGLVAPVAVRGELKDRAARWDLAIKLGRELGSAIDSEPAQAPPPGAARRLRVSARVLAGPWQERLVGAYDPALAVVITDPPFGVGRSTFVDDRPVGEHIAEVLALLPAVRHVFRLPPGEAARGAIPPARRLCAEVATYRRGSARPGTVQHGWHAWAVYGRLRVPSGTGTTRDWVEVRVGDPGPTPAPRRRTHDGMTPWAAADWALRTWAMGYHVLDPFAGTGTIGLRAQALGLEYLGAEVAIDWALAADRLLTRDQLALDL